VKITVGLIQLQCSSLHNVPIYINQSIYLLYLQLGQC